MCQYNHTCHMHSCLNYEIIILYFKWQYLSLKKRDSRTCNSPHYYHNLSKKWFTHTYNDIKYYWHKYMYEWLGLKFMYYRTYIMNHECWLSLEKLNASSWRVLLSLIINDIILYHVIMNDMDETLEYWYTSKTSSISVVLMINEPYIESGIK